MTPKGATQMFNPSYLVKSRHDIFYFRYPLPISPLNGHRSPRISISLKTRCPREALKLAKILEYHSSTLMMRVDLANMDYSDLIQMWKNYFEDLLTEAKANIDKHGPFPERKVKGIQHNLHLLEEVIQGGYEDLHDMDGIEEADEIFLNHVRGAMDKHGVSFAPDSREYRNLVF